MSYEARRWAKQIMAQKFDMHKLISETYKETLRFMLSTFAEFKIINPENAVVDVPCINGSPERTVAKLYQENNISLPIITVFQSVSQESEKRRRIGSLVMPESIWDDTHKRALRVISFAPKAIDITYELNIWTKYNEDMDQLVEQLRAVFTPNIRVVTKYSNTVAAFITNESNNSTVVVGDRQDRLIRRKFDISVEGYIPYPKYLVTSTGEITEFNTEYQIITDSSVDLDASSIAASSINATEIGTFNKK